MGGLLALNPKKRLTAREALQHPWFTSKPLPQWQPDRWLNLGDGVQEAAKESYKDMMEKEKLLRQIDGRNKPKDDGKGVKGGRALSPRSKRLHEQKEKQRREEEAKKIREQERKKASVDGGSRNKDTTGIKNSKVFTSGPGGGAAGDKAANKSSSGGSSTNRPGTIDPAIAADKTLSTSGKKLAHGWIKVLSTSRNRYYYHNKLSGRNEWETP